MPTPQLITYPQEVQIEIGVEQSEGEYPFPKSDEADQLPTVIGQEDDESKPVITFTATTEQQTQDTVDAQFELVEEKVEQEITLKEPTEESHEAVELVLDVKPTPEVEITQEISLSEQPVEEVPEEIQLSLDLKTKEEQVVEEEISLTEHAQPEEKIPEEAEVSLELRPHPQVTISEETVTLEQPVDEAPLEDTEIVLELQPKPETQETTTEISMAPQPAVETPEEVQVVLDLETKPEQDTEEVTFIQQLEQPAEVAPEEAEIVVELKPKPEVQETTEEITLTPQKPVEEQVEVVLDVKTEKEVHEVTEQITVAQEVEEVSEVVLEAPQFVQPILEQVVTEGSEVTLTCKVTGSPLPTITWYRSAEILKLNENYVSDIKEDGTCSLHIASVTMEDDAEFVCEAKNPAGTATCSVDLFVNPAEPEGKAPSFVSTPSRVTVTLGSPFKLTCKIAGNPSPEIFWLKDGDDINSDRFHIDYTEDFVVTLSVDQCTEEDEGVFTLNISNDFGSESFSVDVFVEAELPMFTQPLHDVTVSAGSDATLECVVIGVPAPDVTWLVNSKPVTESDKYHISRQETRAALEVRSVQPEDVDITYECVARNPAGEARTTARITLQVPEVAEDVAEEVTIVTEAPPEQTEVLPEGKAPEFVVKIQTLKVPSGGVADFFCEVVGEPAPKLTWIYNEQPVEEKDRYMFFIEKQQHHLEVYDVTAKDAGKYTVKAENEFGQTECSADLKVLKKKKPKEEKLEAPKFVKVPENVEVKENERAQIICKITGQPRPTATWKRDEKELVDQTLYHTEDYEETYCFEVNQTKPEDAGTYTCLATNTAGKATASIPLSVIEKPVEQAAVVLRHKESTKPPEFVKIFEDKTLMEEKKLILKGSVTGVPRPEVTWYLNSVKIVPSPRINILYEEETVKLLVNKITPEEAGEYKCVATNCAGEAECVANVTVEEKSEPPKFTRALGDRECREGRPARFDCNVTGIPQPEVKWFLEDVELLPDQERVKVEIQTTPRDVQHTLIIEPTIVQDSGTVKAIAVNKAGEDSCVAALLIEMKKEMPKFIKKLQPIDTLEYETIKFETTATAKPEPDVEWCKGDEKIEPSDRVVYGKEGDVFSLTIKEVKLTDAALYTLRLTNPAGQMSTSARLKVTAVKPPKFLKKLEKCVCPEKGTARLPCRVTGFPVPTLTWYLKDIQLEECEAITFEQIKKDNTFAVNIANCVPDMAGPVKVIAKNSGGEVSCTAELVVCGRAPTFVDKPLKCTVLNGDTAIFKCRIDGEPKPKVEWTKGKWKKMENTKTVKVHYEQETDQYVLEMADIKPKDAGTYTVTISNEYGSDSAPATLMVTDKEEEAQDWKAQLKKTDVQTKEEEEVEYDWRSALRKSSVIEGPEIDEAEEVKLRHVEQPPLEEEPLPERLIPELGEFEHTPLEFDKRKKSVVEEKEVIKPTVTEEEVIIDEAADQYQRQPKTTAEEVTEEFKLKIPKVKWEFTKEIEDQAVKEKDSAVFECSVTIKNVPVKWFVDNVEVVPSQKYQMFDEGKDHRLAINMCKPEDEGEVKCQFKKAVTTARLTVEPLTPAFTMHLDDVTASEHATATFSVELNDEDFNVTWLIKGVEVTPDGDKFTVSKEGLVHTLVVSDVLEADQGTITASVGDVSCDAQLIVEVPGIITDIEDVTVVEGTAAEFSVKVTPEDAEAKWYIDGIEVFESDKFKFISSGHWRYLVIYDTSQFDSGIITVAVDNDRMDAQLLVEESVTTVGIESGLRDMYVEETAIVELTVHLTSQCGRIKWYKDGQRIYASDKFMTIDDNGYRHVLVIENFEKSDEGTYTFVCQGKTTRAKVYIQGL